MTKLVVSIIMPAYNAEKYIGEAIDSILNQTFRDFELIVVNDGSTDNTRSIVSRYSDARIVYFENNENYGLAQVRNIGLSYARGKYIGWLDSDDISLPSRLEKQIRLLNLNPNIGLCGTWVETIGEAPGIIWEYPTSSDTLKCRLLFDNPFATSSMVMRKVCIDQLEKGFDLSFPPAEDYEMWERVSREWDVANIGEVLTYYRIHRSQTTRAQTDRQLNAVWRIQERIIHRLGIYPIEDEKNLHLDIGVKWNFASDFEKFHKVERWFVKLYIANNKLSIFPKGTFRNVLAERFLLTYLACKDMTVSEGIIVQGFIQSKFGIRNLTTIYFIIKRIIMKIIRKLSNHNVISSI